MVELFLIVRIFQRNFQFIRQGRALMRMRKRLQRNRSIFPRIIFISEISQICNTRISIRERDANGINSFQSQCLTSALTSFIRLAKQKWIRASCSGCERDPSGTLSPALPKSSFADRFTRGVPLARARTLSPNEHFSRLRRTLSFVARLKRNVFIASSK